MWNLGDDNERKENVNERYFKYGESEEKKEEKKADSSRYSRMTGSAGTSRARTSYAEQQTGSIRKKKSAWRVLSA